MTLQGTLASKEIWSRRYNVELTVSNYSLHKKIFAFFPFKFYFIFRGRLQGQMADMKGQRNEWDREAWSKTTKNK